MADHMAGPMTRELAIEIAAALLDVDVRACEGEAAKRHCPPNLREQYQARAKRSAEAKAELQKLLGAT